MSIILRQNITIKEKLLKILDDDHYEDWPKALDGLLFAHRAARHNSTGFSPFRILYERDPVLPIDVKFKTDYAILNDRKFDEKYVRHVVDVMTNIRHTVNTSVTMSVEKAQSKQHEDYNKRHKPEYKFELGSKVLRNLKRDDRKGGKYTSPWFGPYTIETIYDSNACVLDSEKGELKSKQYLCNLKLYKEKEFTNKTSVEDKTVFSEPLCSLDRKFKIDSCRQNKHYQQRNAG